VIHHDYTSLALLDPGTKTLRIYAFYFPANQGIFKPDTIVPLENTPAGRAIATGLPCLARGSELDAFPSEVMKILRSEGVQAVCCVPLVHRDRTFGTLNLASRRIDTFTPADVELLQPVGAQIAIAVENALAFKEIDALKDKLAVEKLYLEEEIRSEFNFEEIIGESAALKRALGQVELAAPAGTTVLLLGETGTGKELFARAIHNLSPRRDRTFVKINCAAIPSGLLESELFGHERGAFTGAINQKIGRFELADKGTLFLDEVGDIPLELQPKLLRVLQEQEFERLGSTRTIRVDVRLVAATNRDLAQMVAEKQFREDLYFRLNVFPIRIPPLRERAGDIPLLVRHFVKKYAQRMSKHIETIPEEAMAALCQYTWPGNIRELQNFIERAVILTPAGVLKIQTGDLQASVPAAAAAPGTLEDVERQHILQALRETGGVIGGRNGAAAKLGLKRTTLFSKMEKLGIARHTKYTALADNERPEQPSRTGN
jgi:formate hydrogenlyase transcriptional activator